MSKTQIELIDAHVGGRIRTRRRQLRLSQKRLGQALGVTYQQVQKHENGTDRLGAGAPVRNGGAPACAGRLSL